MKSSRARAAAVAAALACITGVVGLPAPPAGAAWSTPAFVRSIGGHGRSGIYAWGIAHNPVSDEIIVSDYESFRVRRYGMDGRLRGTLPPPATGGEVFSVATDPTNGDIYVSSTWKKQVHRYSSTGTLIRSISTSTLQYSAWIDVDNQGQLWVVDSADWQTTNVQKIARYNRDGGLLSTWNISLPFPKIPTMFGIGVAADGRVFVPDGNNQRIHVFNGAGQYQSSFGTPEPAAGGLSMDLRGMAIDDARGWLYVSDAPQNEIEKFSLAGTHLQTISDTWADSTLTAPRQLAVDEQGHLWAADYGHHRFREYDTAGNELHVYPHPDDSAAPGHLGQPRDVHVDQTTGNVWVVDTANQRFEKYGPDGTRLGTWGRRGPGDFGLNYPSAIGFDPSRRRVWVSNEEGRNIKVYDENVNYLFIVGQQAKTPEDRGYLQNPTDLDFYNDKVYVSDERSQVIKILDAKDGEERAKFSRKNHGLAINPANGDLYVVNYVDDRIDVHDQNGGFKFSFGSRGNGNGQFQFGRDAEIVNGVLYVVDSQLSRVQAFDLTGAFLGKWGGAGANAYQWKQPTGISRDGLGRLYVADMGGSRVTVFDTNTPRPAYESTKPTLTVGSPANGQVFSGGPVVMTGSAADNLRVANVEVAVQEPASGLWWNGSTGTWETSAFWNISPWSGPDPATSVQWRYSFPSVEYGRSYRAEVQVRDISNNLSAKVVRTFSLLTPGNDTTAPTGAITSPTSGQSFPMGAVPVQGTATDNISVAAAEVAIKRTGSSEWWQPGGGWGAMRWLGAGLGTPGAASTSWSYSWAAPATGQYQVKARFTDAAGNRSAQTALVPFSVTDGQPPDTVAPNGTAAVPAANQVFAPGGLTFSGNATDNVGVDAVKIGIKNTATNQWLRSNGTWGAFQGLDATLGTPGGTATTWSFGWNASPGSYAVQVNALDGAGNADPTKPWVPFSVA